MIQIYNPAREIEDLLRVRVTRVQLIDGNVQTDVEYEGQPRRISEEPEQVFSALRVTDGKLIGAELRGRDMYYTLAEIGQLYTRPGFLERDWLERDGRMRALTGVRLAGDGVDYEVMDGGRPDVIHESEVSVLRKLRILGVRLKGAEFRDGTGYYTVVESN